MDDKKGLKRGLLLSIVIIFSFVLGVLSPLELKKKDDKLDIFEEIYNVLSEHWYYGDDTDMINRAINALYTQKDDPFTFILEKDTSVMDTASGKGIGVTISDYGGYVFVEEVYNGPNRTVLREGDIITKVKGTSLNGKTFSESTELLALATADDSFEVTLIRDDQEMNITLTVGDYDDNITVNLIENKSEYLALQITEFGSRTGIEFGSYLEDYGNVDNLIIDLRGNPGGYITSVINVASYLLPYNSPVMSVKDRDGNSTTYYTTKEDYYTFNHIYVLIDENSASGAEALTLCLMDNAQVINDINVTVLGQKSYGKGSAQQDYELSNGYSIHCTYALWYSPNGTNINKVGITPTSGYELDYVGYNDYYYSYGLLKFEDQNNNVLKLQHQLKMLGYTDIRVHGYFDELTVDAIEDIQKENELTISGKVDIYTFNVIKRQLVDKLKEQKENEYNYVLSLIGE